MILVVLLLGALIVTTSDLSKDGKNEAEKAKNNRPTHTRKYTN